VVLVNPNLGHPLFLNIDPNLKRTNFKVSLLFISNIENPEDFRENIKDKLQIVPILDYKWSFKLLLEKEKEKMKKTWEKIKNIFRRKKVKIVEKGGEGVEARTLLRLTRLRSRIYRGKPLIPTIIKIEPTSPISINDLKYLDNEYTNPQDYLLKNYVFERLDVFYKVAIEFELSLEILDFFTIRNFIMFDIIQGDQSNPDRINYHSLVISKNDWKNLTIVHATDLHLARRNDQIYEIIKEWLDTFKIENIDIIEKEYEKAEKEKKREERAPLFKLPLKKRFINPNNQFRIFIKLMNKMVFQNELDFIVLTGDIVDFTLFSKLPKDIKKFVDFDYDFTNWKTFKEIVLNRPKKKRIGVVKGEELLCPIFTIPGNHDYRPYHYDIRWAGMHRKIGLKLEEALALNDKLLAFPVSAILKSNRALRAYWAEVNPLNDFSLKLGNNNFIFLNSGADSFKNFTHFISGHPSLSGLTRKQIIYLQNLTWQKINSNSDNTFLFVHGPPLNTRGRRSIFKRIKKRFNRKILTKIDEFKESLLTKLGIRKPSKFRIDGKFNVKFGTVSTNWSDLIQFCKDYCVLTLSGHTHSLKEFRLGDPKEGKTKVFDAPPFSFKKVENPAAVFYDIYSEICTNAEQIEKTGPFVVQTPALGLGGYRNPELAGAYREIVIKEGKLESFKVKYIDR
jgi:hypothetical protein